MHRAGTRQWQRQPRRQIGRHVQHSSAAASCGVVFATVMCASQNRYRDMCVHEQRGSDLELPCFQTNPTARSPTRSLQASAFCDSSMELSLLVIVDGGGGEDVEAAADSKAHAAHAVFGDIGCSSTDGCGCGGSSGGNTVWGRAPSGGGGGAWTTLRTADQQRASQELKLHLHTLAKAAVLTLKLWRHLRCCSATARRSLTASRRKNRIVAPIL